jgi:hypothetical protein
LLPQYNHTRLVLAHLMLFALHRWS